MRKTIVPSYVLQAQNCANTRAFKAKKRAELKAVCKALGTLRLGCAYVPGYEHIDDVAKHLEAWRHEMSEKQWGR